MDTVYRVSMQKPFALSRTLWDSSAGLATPKAQGFLSITQAATEQDSRLSKGTVGGNGIRLVEWIEDYGLVTGDHGIHSSTQMSLVNSRATRFVCALGAREDE